MKKLSVILVMLAAMNTSGQWQQDVRLSNNPSTSFTSLNQTYCIASSGNFVHVVWFDNRDGNDEIYYKRSTDEGVSWSDDIRLTNDGFTSSHPSIAVSGSDVRVAWQDNRSDGRYELYYKRSTDAGVTWGIDTRLTNNAGESRYPNIAVSGSTTHLIWYNWREARMEIYYKKSLDGTNWGPDIRLTENDTVVSSSPSVAVYNLGVHIVWVDERDDNKEIYYKRSTNGGTTWGSDIRLTNNTAISQKPCIAVSPQGEVHVVWIDNRDGNYEIYYKGSMDGGTNWGADKRLTNNTSNSYHPSVAVSDSLQGRVHVVWMDHLGGSDEIFYKHSTNGGLNWESDTRLTNAANPSEYPSVCGSSRGGAHVIWQDKRDGNYEIYYKRNISAATGIENINSKVPNRIELDQNFPNPFNESTTICWQIPEKSHIVLKVYDFTGREVKTLVDSEKTMGEHSVKFEAADLPDGVYIYQLQANENVETKKMIVYK